MECCKRDQSVLGILIRLSRTTTLGNNGPLCDFRFADAGTITEGWPPEDLPEFRQ
jgi:hypothetical protein